MRGWQNDDKTQGKGRTWHVVLCTFLNLHRRSKTFGTYEDQTGIHFVRLHSSTNYQDAHLSEKKSFTFHIPPQMYDDRSHKSHNARAAQKKFDNAQQDFVMFLFHVHLFICLSLSNSTYTALTTNGYPCFIALRFKLHNAYPVLCSLHDNPCY